MTLTTLMQKINGGSESPCGGICSPDVLRLTLQEERARSNRSRSEFSFIRFELRSPGIHTESLSDLARALSERVRAIDKVGWTAKNSLGVVLPATSSSGAKTLAEEVLSHHDPDGVMISYTIYTYPFSMIEG